MTPRRIVRVYVLVAGLYTLSASLIWGVNTLFLLDAGLDIAEVFLVNAAFTASMVLFEVPTGVLADTRGRRASFLCSLVVMFVSTLGYVAAGVGGGGTPPLVLASVGLGLGYTFYSGAVEAWLVDALQASGFEGDLDRVFAQGQIATGSAMIVGAAAGGLLGGLDLAVPFLVRAGLLVPVFAIAWRTMHDLGFSPRPVRLSAIPEEMRTVLRAGLDHGWRQPQVRLLFLAALAQYGFLAWAFYAAQPHFLALADRSAPWLAGVLAALFAVSTIAGNTLVKRFARLCGRRTTLLLWAGAVQSVAAVGVGLTDSFWPALGLFLLVAGAVGVTGPVKQAFLHQLVPAGQRATVVSFDAMFADAGSGVGQVGLGYLSRAESIPAGFVVGGLVSALSLPAVTALRRLGGRADRMVGTGGARAACAAQGLPPVTSLDPAPRVATAAGRETDL